jgi:hypothetical protein
VVPPLIRLHSLTVPIRSMHCEWRRGDVVCRRLLNPGASGVCWNSILGAVLRLIKDWQIIVRAYYSVVRVKPINSLGVKIYQAAGGLEPLPLGYYFHREGPLFKNVSPIVKRKSQPYQFHLDDLCQRGCGLSPVFDTAVLSIQDSNKEFYRGNEPRRSSYDGRVLSAPRTMLCILRSRRVRWQILRSPVGPGKRPSSVVITVENGGLS